MSATHDLTALSRELRSQQDFQAQATTLFDHLAGAFATPDASLHVVGIYLRDQDGYLAVHVSGERSSSAALRSASMWQWIERGGEVVLLDLLLQVLSSPGKAGEAKTTELTVLGAGDVASHQLELSGSLVNLLEGPTTHVMAIPLWGFGRSLKGMLTLELEAPACTGLPERLLAASADLELIATIAGPQLIPTTRAAPHENHLRDEWLPIVGKRMTNKLSVLERFAMTDETLLLSGASGSGKSRIARWCHARSPRAEEPFETLNLLAVPKEMQMAELFGWRKGAFTGAVGDVPGALERAGGGTLFIDEIDKLSMDAQAGLLQLLEEGTWRKLGDKGKARTTDARFIVGTNLDLLEQVKAGAFREDLYYRINVLPMHLPTLAERSDEIAGWAAFMLTRAARDQDAEISAEALRVLERQPWPGNLRQLDNVIRRAWIMTSVRQETTVTCQDIDAAMGLEKQLGPSIDEDHMEADTPSATLMAVFEDAADAFIKLALEAQQRDEEVSLDLVDGLRGKVIEAAREHYDGDLDLALALLGRGGSVENRNQHRILKRERVRLTALEAFLARLDAAAGSGRGRT